VLVEFPEPGVSERAVLWERVLPPGVPTAGDLSLRALAERFEVTGAEIRDAAIEAAYLAADGEGAITRAHLEEGIRRQFAKAGKTAR